MKEKGYLELIIQLKEKRYLELIKQLPFLLEDCESLISNLSNFTALIKQVFPSFSWVGFYLKEKDELLLGPFQGNVACTKIPLGSGVCGTSASNRQIIIVPNVHDFPGHIACDEKSKSEIVLPIVVKDKLFGVLDIDSYEENNFDSIDAKYLNQLLDILIKHI